LSITSKDIAKMAGVSRSAVSAVLNGHYNKVSLEKREKILAIARDLRYRPNPAALGLAKRDTKTIGLLTSPFMSAIYSDLVSKISLCLGEKNYACPIVLSADAEQEREAVRHFESFGVDGIIAAYAINDVRQYYGRIPIVSMSPYPEQYELRVDLQESMRIAVEHLRSHGHEKVGMICPQLSVVPLQWEGYIAAVDKKKAYRIETTDNPQFKSQLEQALHEMGVKAWVVSNDFLAARTMRYLLTQGYRIPEDAAIVGFDGSAMGEVTPVPLTSVVFPAAKIASACIDLMLKKIETADTEFQESPLLIKPRLHTGGSCGCPAQAPDTVNWAGEPITFDNED
jgi:DNA-binding LacI/PurR family transcriptional regulator